MSVQERRDLASQVRAIRDDDAPPTEVSGANTLTETLAGAHPADIAEAMRDLSDRDAIRVFEALDNTRAAEVLDEVPSNLSRLLIAEGTPARTAELLDRLPMDDAAEVVAELSETHPEQADALLADLHARAPEDAAEVRALLGYPEKSAGRLMTDKFVRLGREQTIAEAFAVLRRDALHVETLTDLYVVEEAAGGDRLIGLLNLRHLVRAYPEQTVGQVMVREPLTVTVDSPQQDVARLISKYDFLAMPVLDRQGFLAGIVTVDDVIDVLVEEFNEDYLKLVGSDAEEMERRTPAQVARLRLPWLMGTMAIELIAGVVIAQHSEVLVAVPLLSSFMPVISAISGNVGLQAAAIIVRGLDTGHVSLGSVRRIVRKEVVTALMMAVICGVVLGIIGALWSRHVTFGAVIGGAMCASMLTASVMGTVIPMLSKRLGFDPATTAGPFETAFQDVIGFAVFLWLASLLLPWLR